MGLVSVSTHVPNLSFPMVEMKPPSANYRVSVKPNIPFENYCVAVYAASRDDWVKGARHVINQSGTGVAYAALQRNLQGEWILERKESVEAVAEFLGPGNMPRHWNGGIIEGGGKVCFQWREKISWQTKYHKYPNKYPIELSWYPAKAFTLAVGGICLLSNQQWEYAAQGGERNLRYATETGDLIGPDGKMLAYCSVDEAQDDTIAVDDSRNSRTPDGIVGMTGNVWEWTDENLRKEHPYVVRGGTRFSNNLGGLRVDYRGFDSVSGDRYIDFGVRFGAVVPRTQE